MSNGTTCKEGCEHTENFVGRNKEGKAGAAFHEIPPTDFFPDNSDVNERKMKLKLIQVDKELKLFSSHKTASRTKELEKGTLKLTMERSSG